MVCILRAIPACAVRTPLVQHHSIGVDVVMAAAAAADGKKACQGGRATVYHAASAASHPFSVVSAYQAMHEFWTDNRSPARLPFARWGVKAVTQWSWGLGLDLIQ